MSRYGGALTISCTELSLMVLVVFDVVFKNFAVFAAWLRFSRCSAERLRSRPFDFLRIIFLVSRYSGICWRFSLMRIWDLADTAWFGGKV